MTREQKEDFLVELGKLHERNELSKRVGPDYFEPGMMEYLDQSEGIFNEETGQVLMRFEAKGTRYDGRTEQIEKVRLGDVIQVVREKENPYNANNFTLLTQKGHNVGNMPAQLCNVMAPLYDSGELTFTRARVSFVEPISQRSRHAKQAVLFVELNGVLAKSNEEDEEMKIMRMRGVPGEGKREELIKGLSAWLPYGAAYGKDEDGNLVILQFRQPLPAAYKTGSFLADDDAEYDWRLYGFKEELVTELPFEDEGPESEEEYRQILNNVLNDQAKQIIQKTGHEEEETEELKTQLEPKTCENGSTVFQLDIQGKVTGQSYQMIPLQGARAALLIRKTIQVGTWMTFSVVNLTFVIGQGKKLGWYTAEVSIPEEEDNFESYIRCLTPVLQSMELDVDAPVSERAVQAEPEKEPENPKPVKPLYDQNGRIDAFVALKLIEDGAIPIRFEDMAWENGHRMLQSGNLCPDKAGVYQDNFDLDSSQDIVSSLRKLISFLENDESLRIPAGSQTRKMRSRFHGEDLTGLVWLYLASSHLFRIEEEGNTYDIWSGTSFDQAIADGPKRMELLVRSLRAFNSRSGGFTLRCWEQEKEDRQEPMAVERPKPVIPVFTAGGKMMLTTFVELLSTDKIDYCDSRIGWDGVHYDVIDVTLAIDNDVSQEAVQAFISAFGTLEQDESLRIPSDQVSPQLRNFVADHVSHGFTMRMSVGSGEEPEVQGSERFAAQMEGKPEMAAVQDVTGSILLHMVLWEKLIIQEAGKDHFIAYVDQGLSQGIRNCEIYIRRLIAALRSIDGTDGEFELECRIFSDWGSAYPWPMVFEKTGRESCRTISCKDMESRQSTALKGYDATEEEKMEAVPFDEGEAVSVSGKTFVLTGDFAHDGNDRERISERITAKGGRVTTAVSGKTNYLVIGKEGNFGSRKVEQTKEQRAKRNDIKIIREDDLFQALESKKTGAKEAEKSVVKKPAVSPEKPVPEKSAAAKIALEELEAEVNALEKSIKEKKEKAIEEYRKRVNADYEKKRAEIQAEQDSLYSEKAGYELELQKTGFFQFSKKSSLRKIIRGMDIRITEKQSELDEAQKRQRQALKLPYSKIDGQIQKELEQEMKHLAEEKRRLACKALECLEGEEQRLGEKILCILGTEPMTTEDINAVLGTDLTALRMASMMAKLKGVSTTKVVRKMTNFKGLVAEREYAGYYL